MDQLLRRGSRVVVLVAFAVGRATVCSSFQCQACTKVLRRFPSASTPLSPTTSASPETTSLFSRGNAALESTHPATSEEGVGAWVPLASALSMKGLGPQRIKVMGIDIVLWHTQADEKKGEEVVWSAQTDACAHRLAPLSQGRVDPETNCIECPYHGWQFDSSGNVASVPQLEKETSIESVQNRGGNIQTFPVHAAGDLLFAFLPSSVHGEMFLQSVPPEDVYPDLADGAGAGKEGLPIHVRELPYSFDFLVENLMDPAHIPFAHHKLQGTRDDGGPVAMTKLVSNFTHVELAFEDVSGKRARDAYSSFQRPCYYHYGEYAGEGTDEATGKKGRKPSLKLYVTPVAAGKSRVFLYPFSAKIPTFLLHAGTNRFLNSDIWLHDAEREVVRRKEAGAGENKPAGMDYVVASRSDAGVSAFRRWWEKHGMAAAPPHTFGMSTMAQLGPTALSRREQIDPWEHHTQHCAPCRKSLANIKKARAACALAAAAGVALARRAPVPGLVGVGASLYLRHLLTRMATALEGNPEASGIADRSTSALAD